jgi:hypothetical protein
LQHPPQQLTFAQEMLLANELGKFRGTHAGSERLHLFEIRGFAFSKEIGHI